MLILIVNYFDNKDSSHVGPYRNNLCVNISVSLFVNKIVVEMHPGIALFVQRGVYIFKIFVDVNVMDTAMD